MNNQTKKYSDFVAQVSAALIKAGELAREEAIKTNTGIVVSQNGKVVTISAAELIAERERNARNSTHRI